VRDTRFARFALFVNGLVPLSLLGWDAYYHQLGANPLEFVTHTTGTLALVFLTLSLAVTPLRKLLGLPWLIRFRRMLGVYAFFYAFLHLTAYVWFDKSFNLAAVPADVAKRPFIAVGMFAFLLLLPLAATSTNAMVKRLGGKRWKLLHRAAYVAATAGVVHYWMLVKADTRIPLAFGSVVAILLAYRIIDLVLRRTSDRTAEGPQSEPL
jgi:methionine sulfoxide reductase heme-binding subunit